MPPDSNAQAARNNIAWKIITFLLFVLLSGCSGDDDPPQVTSVTGVFFDGPVVGLDYQCPLGEFHQTNADGEYTCPDGSDVTFHIGPITLGPVAAVTNGFTTPMTLLDPTGAVNLARLLQTLATNPADYKIELDQSLLALIPAQADVTDVGFATVISDAFGFPLVPVDQAVARFNQDIAIYAGTAEQIINPPQADARANPADVFVGDTVQLDGSFTVDIDGDPLRYSWTFDQRPPGSSAVFSNPSAMAPSFVADVAGEYLISLWASDGVAMGADQVRVTAVPVPPGSNASLTNLTLSTGTLDPPFSAGELFYQVSVDNAVGTITVTPQTSAAAASVTVNGAPASNAVPLIVGVNNIPVVVTAEDGVSAQTYQLTVTRQALQLSSNADLSALTLSPGTLDQAIAQGVLAYTATVADTVQSITVTATAAHAGASVSVNGSGVSIQSINLSPGDNAIPIVVQAEDGTTRNYGLTVTVEQPLANFDATLQNLEFGPASGPAQLTPAFDPEGISYSTTVAYSHSWIDVIPTASNPNASIRITNNLIDIPVNSGSSSGQIGLEVGSGNTLQIVVTAVAGNARSYFINVTRLPASNDADLTALDLSSGTLSPGFDPSVPAYNAFVENAVDAITVTPTTSHQFAVVSVNTVAVTSGNASTAQPLNVGENTITVAVVAEDGVTSKDYVITVTRADVADVTEGYLDTLTLSPGTLLPVFSATTPSYSTWVSSTVNSLTVTPAALHVTSTITVNGAAVTSGLPAVVDLVADESVITIVVTSGDGTVSNSYSVTVTRGLPAAPQNLEAIGGDAEVALTWDAVASATAYRIYFGTSPGVTTASAVVTHPSDVAAYTLAPVVNASTYYFRVAAVNAEGEGDLSAEVSATPESFIPKNPRVSSSSGQHVLTWDVLNGADSYSVYWNTTGSVTMADTRVDVVGTSYTHLGLATGQTYYYRVSATAAAQESELSVEIAATQTTSNWQWANPQPQGNQVFDMVWGNGRFIAVGKGGTVLSSVNGSTWAIESSGTTFDLWSITWSGNQFVAVGDWGAVITSPDGTNWSVHSLGDNFAALTDIEWNGSRFVVSGVAGTLYYSGDGIGWREAIHSAAGNVTHLSWSGSLFVAYDAGFTPYTHTSADGISWTRHATTIGNLVDIVWDGSRFVAPSFSAVYSSTDGISWTDLGAPNVNLLTGDVLWNGSQYVGCGQNGLIATSADAVNWTVQTTSSTARFGVLASNGSLYLASADGGVILSSPNAVDWTQQQPTVSVTAENLNDVVWNGSLFVAVGRNGTIVTSVDGDTWTAQDSGSTALSLEGILWTGSQFMVVGSNDTILTSPDGINWTARNSSTTGKWFNGVVWSGSSYVVVGNFGIILSSTDGVNWNTRNDGATDPVDYAFRAVAWDGSQFVTVGDFPVVSRFMTSADGISWTENTSNFVRMSDLIWANSRFVAVGSSGWTLTSTDGLNWSSNFSGISGVVFPHVEWDGSQFVTSVEGTVYTSADGVAWARKESTGFGGSFYSITWDGNGKAVAVGLGGAILTNASW